VVVEEEEEEAEEAPAMSTTILIVRSVDSTKKGDVDLGVRLALLGTDMKS
jgi:hypothetical protein